MDRPIPVKELFDLLYQHELALAGLYGKFAMEFPEYKVMWSQLVQEENNHAEIVQTIRQLLTEGSVRVDRGRFKAMAIQSSLRYVAEQIRKVEAGDITCRQAIGIAFDLENSLLEKIFVEIHSDNSEIEESLNTIIDATKTHRLKLLEQKGQP